MDVSILSGTKKPTKKIRVQNLTRDSAWKRAVKRGKATNHSQIDGRRWRRDHPATPHEHDIPKGPKAGKE